MSKHSMPFDTRPIIAIVGAGSLNWGRGIVVDFMRHPDLANAEIRLIDVLEDRLALVHEWCEFARQRLGTHQTIEAHTQLREGLKGATACLTAISVGGDRLWRYDAMHPQLDGIFQPVGDTIGPGGALRALRHAPAMRRIGLTLAEVGHPGALLLQLTNPLNALTACLDNIPGIRVVGFCHGYDDTERIIASCLHRGPQSAELFQSPKWREKLPTVRVELAGNNHFVFADKIQIGDRIYSQTEIHELTPRIFDGPFREAVWSRFGAYVGNYPRHPIEFLPGFIDARSRYGQDWGVEPLAGEINPVNGERHDNSRAQLESALAAARKDFDTTEHWDLAHSREPLDDIVAAFHSGKRVDVHLNLRNQGALQGLSDDLHLEMYCRIEGGDVIRPSVRLPEAVIREVERVGQCQLKLAACCERYEEDLLLDALRHDALMPADERVSLRLVREMVDFQREWSY
ncbi:MAG: hypothetical protein LAT83_20120 [Kiritimatiellae bacterium]|nr:hypothetical protein [Kiritimatiellia bacterium]